MTKTKIALIALAGVLAIVGGAWLVGGAEAARFAFGFAVFCFGVFAVVAAIAVVVEGWDR